MNLSEILKYFVPKEKKFYKMFNTATENCVSAAIELTVLFNSTSLDEVKASRAAIKELEKKGDNITAKLYEDLNQTFITPFDREDIHDLTSQIDDVVDLIHSLAGKSEVYKFFNFSPMMKDMIKLIYKNSLHIQTAVAGLESNKGMTTALKECKALSKAETKIDDYYHLAISDLFDNEKDAIELIKQKEIILNIEKISNKMEDVADVIRTIILKYA